MLLLLAPAMAFALFVLVSAPVQAQGYPPAPYSDPYAQPAPQYAPPQYTQPQYQQPQYAQPQQPQDQQPQYAQPQYAQPQQPQYGQPQYQQPPQQPDAQQPYAYADQPYPQATPYAPEQDLAQPSGPTQAPLTAEQLEQLLAPIALYPDALLAQILAASTYPAQVAAADQWLGQMRTQGYGSPDQIANGADSQGSWDPSVKSLTATPDVLDMLNHNLQWTTALGNAYYNQPQDVMQTVQVLRQRAEQAGNLQTTPQEDVTNDQGYVELAPPNPEVVYVPTYNPWAVYGAPVAPYPGFSFVGALGAFFGAVPIRYDLCFALGAFERTPFGMMAWGLDWLAHSILFNHADYFTHSRTVADWGLPRGGPRAYYGRGGADRSRDGPYRASDPRGGAYANHGQNYARPSQPARSNDFANRGYQYGATRPALPAQNYQRTVPQNYARVTPQQSYGYRAQAYPNHPQTYSSRSAYGYSGYGYGAQSYANRPNYGYSSPAQAYRAPQSPAYSSRSYSSYGNQLARNDSRSSSFGGSRSNFSARAPQQSFKAPKGFGGGGGRAPSAPKMSRGGGGGRRR